MHATQWPRLRCFPGRHRVGVLTKNRGVIAGGTCASSASLLRVKHVLDSVVAGHLFDLLGEMQPMILSLLELAQRAVQLEELLGPGALVLNLLSQLLLEEVTGSLQHEHLHGQHTQGLFDHLIVKFFQLASGKPTILSSHMCIQ